MGKREDNAAGLISWIIVLGALGIYLGAHLEREKACEARGGVYVSTPLDYVCLKAERMPPERGR